MAKMTAWPVGSKSIDVEALEGADGDCSVTEASTVVTTSRLSDDKSDETGLESEELESDRGSSVSIDTGARYVDRYVMQYVPGARFSYLTSLILAEANVGLTALLSSPKATAWRFILSYYHEILSDSGRQHLQ
jgi:hypothetical protein